MFSIKYDQSLENPSTSLKENIKIIKSIEEKIAETEGPIAEVVNNKLKFVLDKNKGFKSLRQINNILNGTPADKNLEEDMPPCTSTSRIVQI